MNRRGITMTMVAGLTFTMTTIALMFWGFTMKFPGALPWGCDYDGICENSYSAEHRFYDNRLENEELGIFPVNCWKTDCCYDFDYAWSRCGFDDADREALSDSGYFEWYDSLSQEDKDCISKENVEVLIDCIDSRTVCDNETCVQSCNFNDVCESGESTACYDCR